MTFSEDPKTSPGSVERLDIAFPRITGNDLPDDVWRIIALYLHWAPTLGKSLAFPFISVNRSFFDFVLSTKYREVHWVKLDKPFYKALQQLQYVSYLNSISIYIFDAF